MNDQLSLIERILAGDRNAFERIIKEYQRLVWHIVFRMIPNMGDREDICQEVFIRVYQNLSSFRSDSKLSAWIGRIAANRCLDYLRQKNRYLLDDLSEDAMDNITNEDNTPDKEIEAANSAEILKKEINRLPMHFRIIITLYHLDEMNYEEIGEILELPAGTVKSHLFRGRKILRDKLLMKYKREELRP